MKLFSIIFLSITLAVLFVFPDALFAAEDAGGFVTCSGADECNFCSLVDMTNNIVEWLITIGMSFAVLLLAFSGFRLITARGDASALENAKKMLISSFIGILIMLAGWTMVDTFLKIFAGGDLGVWNVVECGGAYESAPASEFGIALDVTTIETANEGQSTGYYFKSYTLNSADSCKQLKTESLPDYGICKAVLAKVISSGSSYVIQDCDGRATVSVPPDWSSLPVCGVPESPSGQICYSGSGSGTVCFDSYPASKIVGTVSGYRYIGSSPPEFISTDNPGQGNSMSTRISPNYTLADFNRSGTCGQGGDPYMYISPNTVNQIERVNQILGSVVGINSGYRSPTCNARVGGVSASQHMQGTGADLAPPGGRAGRCEVVRACRAAGAGFIMTYNTAGHVHCDWAGSRGEILTISCP